ncbi:MAG: hypothetical protein LBI05_07965 [Planctomycetaceae bacterium]|nr:hypothetical protein [Planctomycetaceae bacterium]
MGGYLFSRYSAESNKSKAQKSRRGRSCRIEELESREMLSTTLESLAYDLFTEPQSPDCEMILSQSDDSGSVAVVNLPPVSSASAFAAMLVKMRCRDGKERTGRWFPLVSQNQTRSSPGDLRPPLFVLQKKFLLLTCNFLKSMLYCVHDEKYRFGYAPSGLNFRVRQHFNSRPLGRIGWLHVPSGFAV